MKTLQTYTTTAISLLALLCGAVLAVSRAPIARLDAAVAARGQDPEAGITTLEYVIMAATVLVVVIATAAVVTGALEGWAEKIPGA